MTSQTPSFNRPLSLRQIEVFHAIMTTGSLSAAGRLLYVSQPAISRVLASAENRLGYSLFERTKGRLYPTNEAKHLFAEANSLYQGIHRVNELAISLADDRSRVLRVMSSPTYGEHIIPEAFQRLLKIRQGIRIKYLPVTLDIMIPRMLMGHADVGISMLSPPQHPNLVVNEIETNEVICVVPRSNPLSRLSCIRPQDLEGQILIGYAPETPFGMALADFIQAHDGRIDIDIEVRSSVTACRLVRNGLGVALVDPYCITADLLQHVVALPLNPKIPLTTHLIYSHHESRSNLVSLFLKSLRGVIREQVGQA